MLSALVGMKNMLNTGPENATHFKYFLEGVLTASIDFVSPQFWALHPLILPLCVTTLGRHAGPARPDRSPA